MGEIRVVLVEDDDDLRRLATVLLGRQAGVIVEGEAVTTVGALDLATRLQPDVVVLDNQLLDGEGVSVIAPILEASPGTRVVMCSASHGVAAIALAAGASAFVPKERSSELLVEAVRRANRPG